MPITLSSSDLLAQVSPGLAGFFTGVVKQIKEQITVAGDEKRTEQERSKIIFRVLPIYEAYGPVGHVALVEPRYLPSADVPQNLLDDKFLRVRGRHTADLLKYLEVPTLTKATILIDHVFVRLEELAPDVRNAAMLDALRDMPRLSRDDSRFTSSIQNLAFVPTRGGTLMRPCELYDPHNVELQELVDDGAFPAPGFDTEDIQSVLLRLKMRNSLDCAATLQCAQSIASLPQADALKRSRALLAYLELHLLQMVRVNDLFLGDPATVDWAGQPDTNGTVRFTDPSTDFTVKYNPMSPPADIQEQLAFIQQLRSVQWLPVHVEKTERLLPWPRKKKRAFGAPASTRPYVERWLCSSCLDLFDGEVSNVQPCC